MICRYKGAERNRTAVCGLSGTDEAKTSLVYALQAEHGGPVKIGYSGSKEQLAERLRSNQVGNPWRLRVIWTQPGTRADEKNFHRRFRDARLVGEWFLPVEAICVLTGARNYSDYEVAQALSDGYELGQLSVDNGVPDAHGVSAWEYDEIRKMARH